MTHSAFEISAVRPDPTEFWQQLWQTSHFVHWEKEPARWELLSEPVQVFFLSQSYCFSFCQTAFLYMWKTVCRHLSEQHCSRMSWRLRGKIIFNFWLIVYHCPSSAEVWRVKLVSRNLRALISCRGHPAVVVLEAGGAPGKPPWGLGPPR